MQSIQVLEFIQVIFIESSRIFILIVCAHYIVMSITFDEYT